MVHESAFSSLPRGRESRGCCAGDWLLGCSSSSPAKTRLWGRFPRRSCQSGRRKACERIQPPLRASSNASASILEDFPEHFAKLLRFLHVVVEGQRLALQVSRLRQLHLYRVHAVLRLAVVPGRPAAAEAPVGDRGIAIGRRADGANLLFRRGSQVFPLSVPMLKSGSLPSNRKGRPSGSSGNRRAQPRRAWPSHARFRREYRMVRLVEALDPRRRLRLVGLPAFDPERPVVEIRQWNQPVVFWPG